MNVNKVMMVDDDSGLRTIVEMSLRDDWQVVLAADGKEALKLLASEKPDVVLLDVMMPGMDGLETLAKMREQAPDVPVIFLTAKVQSQEQALYKEKGAAGLIMKPFDPMKLSEEIHDIIRQKRERTGFLRQNVA